MQKNCELVSKKNKAIVTTLFFSIILLIFLMGCIETSDTNNFDNTNNSPKEQENPAVFKDPNYVHDVEEGLIWLKCDYGLAGKECNIPNYCGYDGTSQDSWELKSENNPICDSEKSYGKIIEPKCDAILLEQRFVNTDESGVAVCDNGVLCKDGSFIIVDWREDYKNYEEEYPIIDVITQKEYVRVPNSAKDRACENHGGVETFGYNPIYDWVLPTTTELQTLYDPNFKGINTNKFPNASEKLMSSTTKIGSGTTSTPDKREVLFFDKSIGGTIENCVNSAPVKCAFRVAPAPTIEEPNNEFCSVKIPSKIHIRFKLRTENTAGIEIVDGETWMVITEDYVKSHILSNSNIDYFPNKEYYYFDKKTREVIYASNWVLIQNDFLTEMCDKTSLGIDGETGYYMFAGNIINPMTGTLARVSKLTDKTKIVNGITCMLDSYIDPWGSQECVSKEFCSIVEVMFTKDGIHPYSYYPFKAGEKNFEVISIEYTDFDEKIVEIPSDCKLNDK